MISSRREDAREIYVWCQCKDESRLFSIMKDVVCITCRIKFRREFNRACQKCITERLRLVQEQPDAAEHCQLCKRWFRSSGGLAVRRCREEDVATVGTQVLTVCGECRRSFRRQGDLK